MIEFLTAMSFIIGVLVVNFGKYFDLIVFDYINIDFFLNALYKNLFIFLMFGRLYALVLWNDAIKENKRILLSLGVFALCFVSFGIELYSNIIGNGQLSLFALIIGMIVMFSVKLSSMKKYGKIFGKNYILWHIADLLLVFVIYALLLLTSVIPVYNIIWTAAIMLVALFLINHHIQFVQPYWATNQTFDDLIKFAIINNDVDCLCERTKLKKITDNIIYSECSTILNYSIDRLGGIRKIVKRVEKIFIEDGIDKNKILLMKRNLTLNLVNNLMNRPLDYWRMLPFVRSSMQNFIRNREKYGRKRITV